MPFPKLSPLQSRLAASLVACILVLLLYLTLSSSHFAYASEVDSIKPEDHNHERLLSPYIYDGELDDNEEREGDYQAEFFGVDKSIIGRASAGVPDILNNYYILDNIPEGQSHYYTVSNATLWGKPSGTSQGLPPSRLRQRNDEGLEKKLSSDLHSDFSYDRDEARDLELRPRQQQTRTLYITMNTCLQPSDPNNPTQPPSQLQLYVSLLPQNPINGPGKPDDSYKMQEAVGGFANFTAEASGDVYIGVYAPPTDGITNGTYSVEIAASIDAPFHSYDNSQYNLYLVDSDSSSALLVTNNLTSLTNGSAYDDWMNLRPPFVIFAANQNKTDFAGVQNSYCGLEMAAQIAGTNGGVRSSAVQTSMTNMTSGPFPKQQFYFQGLNGSSSYHAVLAMTGNSTMQGNGVVGGGGQVWKTMNFATQSDGNCAVIFNLSFCDSVAYAVPGNPNTYPNVTGLAAFYDSAAKNAYTNFDLNMQQIPCEIDSTGQYSLARNCNDCRNAYKSWLCSVMIPRCMDYSSTAPYLQERNVVNPFPNSTSLDPAYISQAQQVLYLNSSRNPAIDWMVKPGPYKEILPCDDLCYGIVQSCPAAMGFSCPRPGQQAFNYSYGVRQAGSITCNYPGAVYDLNTGSIRAVPSLSIAATLLLSLLLI